MIQNIIEKKMQYVMVFEIALLIQLIVGQIWETHPRP